MSIVFELWEFAGSSRLSRPSSTPILIAALYYAFRRLYRAFQALRLAEAARKAVAREMHNGVWTEGPGFWLKLPIARPKNYNDLQGNSMPILMIAATKGGVGKTSLAGSLAGSFRTEVDPKTARPRCGHATAGSGDRSGFPGFVHYDDGSRQLSLRRSLRRQIGLSVANSATAASNRKRR